MTKRLFIGAQSVCASCGLGSVVEALIEKLVIGDGNIDVIYSCLPPSEELCKTSRGQDTGEGELNPRGRQSALIHILVPSASVFIGVHPWLKDHQIAKETQRFFRHHLKPFKEF